MDDGRHLEEAVFHPNARSCRELGDALLGTLLPCLAVWDGIHLGGSHGTHSGLQCLTQV